MELWQTGNIGPYNIKKIDKTPDFETEADAETWLENNKKASQKSWHTISIIKVYIPE